MKPQAQTDSLRLLDDLNAFARSGVVDAMALRRFRKRAEALRAVSLLEGLVALGAIAALEGRAEEMLGLQKRAIALDPSNIAVALNFATSCERLGLVEEMAELTSRAYRIASSDVAIVDKHVRALLRTGRYEDASGLVRASSTNPLAPRIDYFDHVSIVSSVLRANRVSQDTFVAFSSTCASTLRPLISYFTSISPQVLGDPHSDDCVIRMKFRVSGRERTEMELNDAVATALAEHDSWPAVLSFLVSFPSATDGDTTTRAA